MMCYRQRHSFLAASMFWLLSLLAIDSYSQTLPINAVLETHDLSPQMVSYHPDGTWLITANLQDGNRYSLLRIRQASSPKGCTSFRVSPIAMASQNC